ncbi:MAG: hypothetical protein DRI89_03515 [Bacteroidetes bacterium]|nr:MAG: hypothetical protein DRI89_03515 [Bacteroidota bacterium]
MKKSGIVILLVAFVGMSLTMAQQGRQQQNDTEMKAYFEKNILPVVEAEQKNFYKALSTDEIKKLEELKGQMKTRMNRTGKGNGSGNGNGNGRGGQQQGRQAFQSLFTEASKIADAHPKEKKHFQKTMDDNKDKWMQDLTKICEENNPGGGRGHYANNSPMFDHFSDPGWLLLWDKDRKNFQQMARMGRKGSAMHGSGMGKGNGQGKGRHGDGNGEGGGHGNGIGMQNGMGPNQNINPELRAEIRDYAQKNIIPVISKERKAFDSILNDTEKDQIALAQGKRKARRIMFREWYKSEDFDPGARRDDPNFDMMREDMQKSMKEVRAIAATHDSEIEKSMDNIDAYSKVWASKIKTITDKYQSGQNNNSRGYNHHLRQMASPVNFLLFNYNETENTSLFDIDRKNMLIVEVYPNPATSHATVRIAGIHNQLTEVNLYTKEGSMIKPLYNEQVEGEEVTFGFSVADLENNIYLVKVKAGETVVARKIIVQK